MKIHLKTHRSKVVATALFCLFSVGIALGQQSVKVTLQNNSVQVYSVDPDGKLWFNNSTLMINVDGVATPVSIPLSTIRTVTFDGSTTGIANVANDNESIIIFPNPAENYFEVESAGTKKMIVRIFNTAGLQVAEGIYTSGSRIDITSLAKGIYIVVINNQSFKLTKS